VLQQLRLRGRFILTVKPGNDWEGEMNMPEFSADVSLYKMRGHYQTDRHTINSSTLLITKLTAFVFALGIRGRTC
jgi:hypothetical protein